MRKITFNKKGNATVRVGKRLPAAVIKDDKGNEIVVDKFGKEVKDHGYDLKNDPRGWKTSGAQKAKRTIIK